MSTKTKKLESMPKIIRGRRILIKKPIPTPVDSSIILSAEAQKEREDEQNEDLYKRVELLMIGNGVEDKDLKPGVIAMVETRGLQTAEVLLINDELYLIIADQHIGIIW